MTRRFVLMLAAAALVIGGIAAEKEAAPAAFSYHNPSQVALALKEMAGRYPLLAAVVPLGKSASKSDLALIRIAAAGKDKTKIDSRPAVLVTANLEGLHLIGTEAALALAEKLLSSYGTDKSVTALLETRTVYVAPLLNPDAALAYFSPVRQERSLNGRPVDDDADGALDEDGFDDLNGDGLITRMRVKDPEGKWIVDPQEPRLMREADPLKGEKGLYAVYAEGIDNDGDGQYNEDPPGGVEPNRNFPHDFEYNTKPAGPWPVSEDESRSLARFLYDHPAIGLVLNFSTENTLLNMQQTGQAKAGSDKVKVPKMYAGFMGLDPDQEYTLKEIVDVLKSLGVGGGVDFTEDLVAQFLGLGPAVAIDRQDQPLFDAVQKDYKDALKAAKLEYPEKRAKGVGRGSLTAFLYYQYGAPVFSTDVWAVPEPKKEAPKDTLTADKLKAMSSDEFIGLGEEKIDAFLKEAGAPPNFKAAMVINMVKSGQVTPAKMAEMMDKMPKKPGAGEEANSEDYLIKYADSVPGGKAFVPWTPVKHPTLAGAEVGGFAPFLRANPLTAETKAWVEVHVDFYIKLMAKMPELKVGETEVKAIGSGLYEVSLFLTNTGWFPTSTAQGRRSRQAWPIRVALNLGERQTLVTGRRVETIPVINGSGEVKKLTWTVRGPKGSRLEFTCSSPRLGSLDASATLN